MKIGIIGLAKCGKTTAFNVLTNSNIEVDSFSKGTDLNIRNIKVPDKRLENLRNMYNPKKFTPAEIEYVDVIGITSSENKKGLNSTLVNKIKTCDAFLHIIRLFNNPNVVHEEGSINGFRDFENVDTELILTDLDLVTNKIDRMEKNAKKKKMDKKEEEEYNLMLKCKNFLENFKPLRNLEFSEEEMKILNGYQLLSLKPCLVVLNIDENDISRAEIIEKEYAEKLKINVTSMCAKIEMEISQLNDEEKEIFMADLGLKESSLDKIIRLSYNLLGLISFFTVGEDEVRAWTITKGTKALKAAGKIHSDIEKGFIRAEIIHYDDLIAAGNAHKAKEKGHFRLEGKDYIMQDGDIVNFRFNV